MFEDKLHHFTILLALYVPVTFAITYAIAVAVDHVYPGFPYISDTGAYPPESCVFGQLLNIGAVIAVFVVYVRYKQIATFYKNSGRTTLLRTNIAALVLGLITAFGVSLVGNFQETSVVVVHLIGAFLAFGIGGIYCYVQTGLSFRMKTDLPGSTANMTKIRLALSIIDFVLLITLFVSSRQAGVNDNHFKWKPSDPGYAPHLVSTISEWLIAFVTVFYFTTFFKEFRKCRLICPELVFSEMEKKPEENGHDISIPQHLTGSSLPS